MQDLKSNIQSSRNTINTGLTYLTTTGNDRISPGCKVSCIIATNLKSQKVSNGFSAAEIAQDKQTKDIMTQQTQAQNEMQ